MRAIPKCLLKRGGVLVTEVVEAKRGKWERGASAYGARVVNEEDRGGKRGGGGEECTVDGLRLDTQSRPGVLYPGIIEPGRASVDGKAGATVHWGHVEGACDRRGRGNRVCNDQH